MIFSCTAYSSLTGYRCSYSINPTFIRFFLSCLLKFHYGMLRVRSRLFKSVGFILSPEYFTTFRFIQLMPDFMYHKDSKIQHFLQWP